MTNEESAYSNIRVDAYDISGKRTWAIVIKCPYCGFQYYAIKGDVSQYRYCHRCRNGIKGGDAR